MSRVFKDERLEKTYKTILERIDQGVLIIPKDYSVTDALQAAYFILKDIKIGSGKEAKYFLTLCDSESLIESLFKMVTEGLNPKKQQCAFIPRGNKVTYQRQYQGDIALAKRYSGVKKVTYGIYYEGDKLVFHRNTNGVESLVEHFQPIENLDNPIKGAYAIVVEEDGTEVVTKMTKNMILNSWGFSKKKTFKELKDENLITKSQDAFEDQFCARTVIRRACKPYIFTSTDENILPDKEEQITIQAPEFKQIESTTIEKPKEIKAPVVPQIESKGEVQTQEKLKEPVVDVEAENVEPEF